MTETTTANQRLAEKIAALPKARIKPERIESLPTAFHERARAGELFPVEIRDNPHAVEDLLVLPFEDQNSSMWVNTWQGEHVYSWWVRKSDIESVVGEDGTARVDNAELERLRERVAELEEEVETQKAHHTADMERISERLIREATDREWCGEYDGIIRSLNADLTVPLKPREREYDVELRVVYRMSMTVTASSRAEARRMVDEGEIGPNLSEEIEVDDPYEVEVTDVDTRY